MIHILSSHNSWSYLPVKHWWMNIIKFTARCQSLNLYEQLSVGVRCFDLRIRYDKKGTLIVAHGMVEYKITVTELVAQLYWLDNYSKENSKIYVRILHEARNKKQYNTSFLLFCSFCAGLELRYKNLTFWCGRNLYNWTFDYHFPTPEPSCAELYGSVTPPKWFNGLWPWLYAKRHNAEILSKGTDREILMIDFVNLQKLKK